MKEEGTIDRVIFELGEGVKLSKCRKCGCMRDALDGLQAVISPPQIRVPPSLRARMERWREQMEDIKYPCLGCEHCFPAVAINTFQEAFPELDVSQMLSCTFEVNPRQWPSAPGEYFAFCDGPGCPVAVTTLASVELAERLARVRPRKLCIVGKTETENIGIEKVIVNIVTNPSIRFLVLTGEDPTGHQSGKTMLALWRHGVDENMKVVGSPGRHPVLRNLMREEVEAFRRQVEVVDMIGCVDEGRIVGRIKELARRLEPCFCREGKGELERLVQISKVPVIQAGQPAKSEVEMDEGGYFVIIPRPEKQIIVVEHYYYDHTLRRVIEGRDARSIYMTIIQNGWVTKLSHAAYLGKELAKAELSLKLGFKYVQDGA